jgi:hypothetical protein
MILNHVFFSSVTSITYNSMYKEAAHIRYFLTSCDDGHLSSLTNNRTKEEKKTD